jgi:hypothetical protein
MQPTITRDEAWPSACSFLLVLLLNIMAALTGTDDLTPVYAIVPGTAWTLAIAGSLLGLPAWLTPWTRWLIGAVVGALLCVSLLTLAKQPFANWAASAILVTLLVAVAVIFRRRQAQ